MRRLLLPCSISLLLALSASLAAAAQRSPQVPVSGTALASFFASQGQSINVNADQLVLQQLSENTTTAFEVRVFPTNSGVSLGLHNAAGTAPKQYLVTPGAMTSGWYVQCSFRTQPARLVVSVFDGNNVLQGTTTFNGADAAAFGVYDSGPGGTFYLDDARNPGGAARILAYAGTGSRSGWTWFACETSSGPGGDYADFIALVNLSSGTTPTVPSSWGRVKRLYH